MGEINIKTGRDNITQAKTWSKLTQFRTLTAGAGTTGMKIDKQSLKFGNIWYLSKQDGTPIVQIDQSSNMNFAADAAITWASGRSITADTASMTANGNWLVLGGVRATSYTARQGSTDYVGATTIQEGSVDTFSIEIRNGLVINFNKNS